MAEIQQFFKIGSGDSQFGVFPSVLHTSNEFHSFSSNITYTEGSYLAMVFADYVPIVFTSSDSKGTVVERMLSHMSNLLENYSELTGISFPDISRNIIINLDEDKKRIDLRKTIKRYSDTPEIFLDFVNNFEDTASGQFSSDAINLLRHYDLLGDFKLDLAKLAKVATPIDRMSNKAFHHQLRESNAELDLPPAPQTVELDLRDLRLVHDLEGLKKYFKFKFPNYDGPLFIKPVDKAGGVCVGLIDSEQSFTRFLKEVEQANMVTQYKLDRENRYLLHHESTMDAGLPMDVLAEIAKSCGAGLFIDIQTEFIKDKPQSSIHIYNEEKLPDIQHYHQQMQLFGITKDKKSLNFPYRIRVYDNKLFYSNFLLQEVIKTPDNQNNLPSNIGLSINLIDGQVESYFSTAQIYSDSQKKHYYGSYFDEIINSEVLNLIGKERIENLAKMYINAGYPSTGPIEFDMVLGLDSKGNLQYFDIMDNNLRVTASFGIMAIRKMLKNQGLDIQNVYNLRPGKGIINLGENPFTTLRHLKSLDLLYTEENKCGALFLPCLDSESQSGYPYDIYFVNMSNTQYMSYFYKELRLQLSTHHDIGKMQGNIYF